MASQLTPFGLTIKWILVPVGVALLGYFVVGPRLGKSKVVAISTPPPSYDAAQPQTQDHPTKTEPTVSVDVKPAPSTVSPVHHRRHRRATVKTETSAPDTSPTQESPPSQDDQGGSAGGATAGNETGN